MFKLYSNMRSTAAWRLLTLTWIFLPTLTQQAWVTETSLHNFVDVTYPSGNIKPCEKFEFSVKIRREDIIKKLGEFRAELRRLKLQLYYQKDTYHCNNRQAGMPLAGSLTGSVNHRIDFQNDWSYRETKENGGKNIQAGSIKFKLEGNQGSQLEVNYTIYKFRPYEKQYDTSEQKPCLTIQTEAIGDKKIQDDRITFDVNFQRGPKCEPENGKCQYKDGYQDKGFCFNEISKPFSIIECTCKADSKFHCEYSDISDISKVKDKIEAPYIPTNYTETPMDYESDDTGPKSPKEKNMMIAYAIAGGAGGLVVIGLASFLIYNYCCVRSGCRRPVEGNTFSFNDEIEVRYSTKPSQNGQGSQASKGGRMSQMSGVRGSVRGSQMSGIRGSQMSNFSGLSSRN